MRENSTQIKEIEKYKKEEGVTVKNLIIIGAGGHGKVIADISGKNQRQVILKGGRGGLGNQNFATATMQAPKYAQPGQPGHERRGICGAAPS